MRYMKHEVWSYDITYVLRVVPNYSNMHYAKHEYLQIPWQSQNQFYCT